MSKTETKKATVSMYVMNWAVSKTDAKKQWVSVNEVRDSLISLVIKQGYPKTMIINYNHIIDMIITDTHNYWLKQSGITACKYDIKNLSIIFNTADVEKSISASKVRSLGFEPTTEQIEREKNEQQENMTARFAEYSQTLAELGIDVGMLND